VTQHAAEIRRQLAESAKVKESFSDDLPKDVPVTLSTSGASPNVVRGVEAASALEPMLWDSPAKLAVHWRKR
jgi:hypothetical protein